MRLSPGFIIIICAAALAAVTAAGFFFYLDDAKRTPPPVAIRPADISVLSFAGDIMAHDVNFYSTPYEAIYKDVAPLLKSDLLSFANLEFPVDPSKPYSNYPRFNNHLPYVEAAVAAGFQVFSAANNHAADQGPDSILATRRTLAGLEQRLGVRWSGLRSSPEDPITPQTIEAGGMKIGFLAVTFFLNLQEGSGLVYKINYRNPERRKAFLEYLRAVTPSYDLFILSVHGGVEYNTEPYPLKAGYFHQLVDAGVDVVWGHHPHVLQPYEFLHLPGGRTALIINSAGNFISGQTWRMEPDDIFTKHPARAESAIYRVRLVRHRNGAVSICGVDTVPIVTYRDKEQGMVVRRYESLKKDSAVPSQWQNFYRRREEALLRVLRNIDAHNSQP